MIMIGSFLYAMIKVGHFDVRGFLRGLPENAGPFFAVFMMEGQANRLWEQALLGVISLIGIWSTFEIVRNFFRQMAHIL